MLVSSGLSNLLSSNNNWSFELNLYTHQFAAIFRSLFFSFFDIFFLLILDTRSTTPQSAGKKSNNG